MKYRAIDIEPSIMHVKAIYQGTNVTIQTLFEYQDDEKSLIKFLNDYPAVNKKDAIEVLQMAEFAMTTEKILKENFSE